MPRAYIEGYIIEVKQGEYGLILTVRIKEPYLPLEPINPSDEERELYERKVKEWKRKKRRSHQLHPGPIAFWYRSAQWW